MEQHREAKFIVESLTKEGFIAYYAGGWVRDYLLNHPSDDIDIATSAPPVTIQALFPKTVPIGISFGIILVLIEDKQFEVATFRSDLEYKDGRRPTKIAFTTAEEDAKRRDFTINGMFYDPLKDQILDFVDGQRDIKKRIIRCIGNPHERIKEDRLRMIRAVRLACRLKFTIDSETIKAIITHAKELFPPVAIERVWQEFTKMAAFPGFRDALIKLYEFGLLQEIFPSLKHTTQEELLLLSHALDDFPLDTPVIAYLLELFPKYSLKDKLKLCKHLKLSNLETQFVQFLHDAEKLFQKQEVDNFEWTYFYSNPFATKCVQIFAARLPIHLRHFFLEKQEELKTTLSFWIKRMQERTPLITSYHLQKLGVSPGVKMGQLLREAERTAVNNYLKDPDEILKKLQESPLWKE